MYLRIEFDSCICPTCFSHFGKTGNSGLPLQKLREAIRSLSNISTSEYLMGCALYISPEFPKCNLRTYKDQVLIKDLSFEMKNYAKKYRVALLCKDWWQDMRHSSPRKNWCQSLHLSAPLEHIFCLFFSFNATTYKSVCQTHGTDKYFVTFGFYDSRSAQLSLNF